MAKTEPKANGLESLGGDAQGDFAQFTDFMRRLVLVPPEVVRERIKAAKKPRVSPASLVPASEKTNR